MVIQSHNLLALLPEHRIHLALCPVSAGFPSPADDYVEPSLDLNDYLVRHPAATFYVRVQGESMKDAAINHGDLLIVDRSLDARDGQIIVAILNGEFTVKRLRKRDGKLFLCPENPDYQPIEISPEADFAVWGVVIHVLHTLVN